jgi:putative DNA methylase
LSDDKPKRLIEVDLPIRRISEQARREKSIRHGHISTLHIWWARRPLAACRSVVLAGLLPDPADDACPQSFRKDALKALRPLPGRMRPNDDRNGLRQALLDFIADFSDWDRSADPTYIKAARSLVTAAYPDGPPVVMDPFAGGGAIPLEALRVGADAWASDLNPVAVLLEKIVLEYIPRYGDRLADGVRIWGDWIKEQAKVELGTFYPSDSDGNAPIAYLWARTCLCEGPGCGARVPLVRSLWLAKRPGRSIALRVHVSDHEVSFSIQAGISARDVGPGTVKRGALVCPVCNHTTPQSAVERQARLQGLPERLIGVVATFDGVQGRQYRQPTQNDLRAVAEAKAELARRAGDAKNPTVPSETITPIRSCTNVVVYGLTTYGDLFTPRQALALTTFARLIRDSRDKIADQYPELPGLASAITTCLGIALDKQADYNSSVTRWVPAGEFIGNTFGRQALPMVWDFTEVNPFSGATGDWAGTLDWIVKVIRAGAAAQMTPGTVSQASAAALPLPDESVTMVCTDPPYYNAVPYADLSDFFYVWLQRSLGAHYPELLAAPRPDQVDEIISSFSPGHVPHKTGAWFESRMRVALTEAKRVLKDDGIAVVVFAHTSTSGWEAMLQALVGAGWTVTGSWPIDTEMGARLSARNSASLASSVHLVCRSRPADAGVGDWSSILRELQPRVDSWMQRLSSEGVIGADAIFACLGPAIELYSRFDRVETAGGTLVPLGGHSASGEDYLSHVWAAVARAALRTIFDEAEATGFEADGRLAAVWLWTLGAGQHAANGEPPDDDDSDDDRGGQEAKNKSAGFLLPYDTARKLAQPLGADLAQLGSRPGAAFQVSGATARMLPVTERGKYLLDSEDGPPRRRAQASLFDSEQEFADIGGVKRGATTLDRVHQAMLLFHQDRGDALRRLLVEDGAGDDPRFWRLADALSKLYPATSLEKRWVDGVLGRKRMLNL